MKYNILYLIALCLLAAGFTACEEDDFDPGGVRAQALAGEWFVETVLNGQVVLGYQQIATYNTAANTAADIWVDDLGHIWPFKVRAQGDINALTFSGSNMTNTYTDTTAVSILEGVILENAATSSGGNRTDSIFMRVEFSDDPGVQYEIAGYRRTGFLEDEH